MSLSLLSGIRVLDVSQYIPGPVAAQILADLGASVIKVEPPGGDPMRRFSPPDSDGLAPDYKLINAGKQVVRIDLKGAEGQAFLERLLKVADVLIESFRPGTLDRLGFDRARLEALNPRLVHVALSGWGQDGPYRLRAGHDLTYVAVGGGLIGSGTPAAPVMTCPPMGDHAGATQAALAALAGLLGRAGSGRGHHFDISLMETVLGWQSIPLTLAHRGQLPGRGDGLLTGGGAYYTLYQTADHRFVALGAIEPKFWEAFCTAVGRADWLDRQNEPMPQTALTAELAALFASRPQEHWKELLDPVDCCFEAVVDFTELPAHPQVAARGQVVSHPGSEPLVEALLGLRMDGGSPPSRTPLAEIEPAAALSAWG
jgi:crotonobetainyl-CoA:carnitine CoA-transferase CaiB-like acyl-CoA transferase